MYTPMNVQPGVLPAFLRAQFEHFGAQPHTIEELQSWDIPTLQLLEVGEVAYIVYLQNGSAYALSTVLLSETLEKDNVPRPDRDAREQALEWKELSVDILDENTTSSRPQAVRVERHADVYAVALVPWHIAKEEVKTWVQSARTLAHA